MVNFVSFDEVVSASDVMFKYVGVDKQRDNLSIVDKNFTWHLKTHYVRGYGSFECFGGQCCMDGLQESEHFIVPVLKYSTGAKITDYKVPVQFLFWKITKKTHSKLKDIAESGNDLNDVDFRVQTTDKVIKESKFQEFDITAINNPSEAGAKWRKDPETVKEAKEYLEVYKNHIEGTQKLRKMDAKKYNNLENEQEYISAIKAYEEKLLLAPQGNAYSNSIPNVNQMKRVPQLSQGGGQVVSESEFDALLDDDI